MGQHENNGKEPSQFQLCKYAILCVLSESNSGKSMAELETLTGFRQKDILRLIQKLISFNDISYESNGSHYIYTITKMGIKKRDYFDRTRNYKDYWAPPWKE